MNQSQIDLIEEISNKMVNPFMEMLCSDDYSKVINEDGGYFPDIVFSILSSVLCSCATAFVSIIELENYSHEESFNNTIRIIIEQALEGYKRHFYPKDIH